MKKIAIIGASYLQLPLINKAKEMGFETHVFAWSSGDVGEDVADFFYPISIREKEKILEVCRSIGIDGIISIASDLAMVTVNYIAEELGLVGNSLSSTLITTNKYEMRRVFLNNGDPIPKFVEANGLHSCSLEGLRFPVIVKPTDRSGSRGVTKVYDEKDLEDALGKAMDESFEKRAIIEEFIVGKEYSVEGLSYKGKHTILAHTEKFTTGEPHFVETGHMEPASIDDETKQHIDDVVCKALTSLKIEYGASHSEIKIDEAGHIKIVEIGARMGGDMIGSDLVRYSTGIDYLKAVIQIACGEKPDLTPDSIKCAAEIRFILSREDLDEFRRMQRYESQRILKIIDDSHMELINKTTDSSNRAGCYIVKV